jgi:carbonic anhydrase/acetyltransferase-like protein (isoleucine patch superfamily)
MQKQSEAEYSAVEGRARAPSDRLHKIAVFGGRGGGTHAAMTILNLCEAGQPYSFAGYLNDRLPIGTLIYAGNVLSSFDDWGSLDEDLLFLAPLHQAGRMQQNCARILSLGIPNGRWATLLDTQCQVAKNASIGKGSYALPYTSVATHSIVGAHCTLRFGTRVGNDVTVGDFVFLGMNSVLCSSCRIESGAHIAPGALVGNNVRVGRFAVVGLGAVVTKDVPDYAVVVGNPARLLRMIEPIDLPSWTFA